MDAAEESPVVRELRAFVEWVGAGRKLTATGQITLADARALVSLLETGDELDPRIGDRVFRTKSSAELPGLTRVFLWARAAGLVRTVKGRVVPVKKAAGLLTRPHALWEAAFEAFPTLADAVCPVGYWRSSLLHEEFAPVVRLLLARLYGGAVPVAELRELSWDRASAPFIIEEPERVGVRGINDRDTDRVLAVLDHLGAIKVAGGVAELTALGLGALRRSLGEAGPGEPVYELKVTLLGTGDPVVWRRARVSAGITLARLHRILVAVMGWEGYHLHIFTVGEKRYGHPSGEWDLDLGDETAVRLADVVSGAGARIGWEYDLGDSWEHEIVVEQILAAGESARYPDVMAGEGACPPEDCGGTWGYREFRAALADPAHEDHEHLVGWAGLASADEFDAARFDPDTARRALLELA
ncbi:IS1096 element passenger TnpR family protein [Planomonospora venezuelensis]|uniref:IS1096 element passenger TnpR family protein n=1 Tax=Planomonospora venezuelensis TaxID=1999 RepID=UPI00160AA9D2